ncbi:pyridoxamine 5'-phosphate oxidase family protein [Chloroflexota bacterium]
MAWVMRELTDTEKDAFLKDNFWGILCFAGYEPYAIPIGFQIIEGEIFLRFAPRGRKMEYVYNNRNVCLNICQPSALTSNRHESMPFKSVIIEGELEEVKETDRAKYGLAPLPEGYEVVSFRIRQKRVGTQNLTWD